MKMTNEEAKKIIQYYQNHYASNGSRRLDEALDMSIKAINKRIPQQVNLSGDGYADGNLVYDMADCPNPDCGQTFEEGDENWECNYCPNCGQALNWWGNEEGESTN